MESLSKEKPIHLYRITWRNNAKESFEYWTENYQNAIERKREIEETNGLKFLNFESWYAYSSDYYNKKNKLII